MRIGDYPKAIKMVIPGLPKWEENRAKKRLKSQGLLPQHMTEDLSDAGTLQTVWGERIKAGYYDYLQEYPRPQLVRIYENKKQNEVRECEVTFGYEGYFNLNGLWEYTITKSETLPDNYAGEILVPFSPETELGMAGHTLMPDEYLFYKKEIYLPKCENKRVLLHFGAVDQGCDVYINGEHVGGHVGGYLPFSIEITGKLICGLNELVVRVWDKTDTSYHARGKQKLNPGGMFYHAQSGIWQTVWMETVPDVYIKELRITPHFDEKKVQLNVFIDGEGDYKHTLSYEILDENFVVANVTTKKRNISIPLGESIKEWTPQTPFLYKLRIHLEDKDQVTSYFAMRIFTKEPDDLGVMRLCLNHKPYFQNGVLSQGYWSDSLMTAPDDESYIQDILSMKEAGFNMIRVHCKLESMRFYYHCDRLGMLVWQDMVNGGESYSAMRVTYTPTVIGPLSRRRDNCYQKLGRKNEQSRKEWQKETIKTVHLLYNSPCVCCYVLFNEGWGQFDAKKGVELVRNLDASRMIDHASGWFDQGVGDVHSIHRYFEKLRVEKDPYETDRAKVISEYGGYALRVINHVTGKGLYSYKTYYTKDEFIAAFHEVQDEINALNKQGLSAAVYTQVSDIEEEMNGLLTFDRRENKLKSEVKLVKK